ncbi:MAG TPA: DUF4389 domain-containing protein [Porticoccus sp.]|nr:DUF4389 domain-containing protein [Porticoccus sp.]
METNELSNNLKNTNQWIRILYMVLFAIVFQVSTVVLWLVVVVQALSALITGSPNANVKGLAASLSQFIFDIVRFLSYGTEDKPFPFQSWPEVAVEDEPEAAAEVASEDEPEVVAVEESAEEPAEVK